MSHGGASSSGAAQDGGDQAMSHTDPSHRPYAWGTFGAAADQQQRLKSTWPKAKSKRSTKDNKGWSSKDWEDYDWSSAAAAHDAWQYDSRSAGSWHGGDDGAQSWQGGGADGGDAADGAAGGDGADGDGAPNSWQ